LLPTTFSSRTVLRRNLKSHQPLDPSMPTVLVIDDDPHMGVILTRILMKHGFKIKVAMDGASGIELAINEHPDLIILDVVMPGIDGVEVARRLRGEPACAGIPIVFLTAFAPSVGKREAKGVAVDAFISKPFVVEDLVESIKELTSQH